MNSVYTLKYVLQDEEGDLVDMKFIGVYSSEAKARSAVERLSVKPGFRNAPDAFELAEYTLDLDHWCDGFISWDEAISPA